MDHWAREAERLKGLPWPATKTPGTQAHCLQIASSLMNIRSRVFDTERLLLTNYSVVVLE